MKNIFIILFNLLPFLPFLTTFNYCELCPNHIACNNNGKFNKNCPNDAHILNLGAKEIDTILIAHNTARNKIAGGREFGFPRASRMMKVKWNYELAYLAELSVKKCKTEHDKCKKTLNKKLYGQNLSEEIIAGRNIEDTHQIFTNALLSWYNEKKLSNQGDINYCCGGLRFSEIGHFLQLVQDQVTSIGCAAATFTKSGSKHVLITCNYSHPNIIGKMTYASGNSVASQCHSGKDQFFNNLCKF